MEPQTMQSGVSKVQCHQQAISTSRKTGKQADIGKERIGTFLLGHLIQLAHEVNK